MCCHVLTRGRKCHRAALSKEGLEKPKACYTLSDVTLPEFCVSCLGMLRRNITPHITYSHHITSLGCSTPGMRPSYLQSAPLCTIALQAKYILYTLVAAVSPCHLLFFCLESKCIASHSRVSVGWQLYTDACLRYSIYTIIHILYNM